MWLPITLQYGRFKRDSNIIIAYSLPIRLDLDLKSFFKRPDQDSLFRTVMQLFISL